MKNLFRLLLLLLTLLPVTTQGASVAETAGRTRYKDGPAYIYRLYLRDKDPRRSPYSLQHPSRYLSRRSIERRVRQQLPIDSTDLPVSPRYIAQIERRGGDIIGRSRWQNTVLVRLRDTADIHRISLLPCVTGRKLVWVAPDSVTPTAVRSKYHSSFEAHDSIGGQYYGKAYAQIAALNGHRLHEQDLHGQQMMIAVIDGGFKNVERIPAFRHVNILGERDFVCPPSPSIYAETDHGTKVLSAMALNVPYFYIGSAPRASYWLLRSEDQQTEQEVEEDYWAIAAEFADSVGCDLINSSLGYTTYDHPWMTHHLWHLDGRQAFISREASMLASKGVLLVNSAGNSGMGPWKKLSFPADADHILTVGAVISDAPFTIAPFSSVGPSQDGRIKPDVVAVGAPAFLVNGRGVIMEDMGTSFATPIVCGLVACLWQARPSLSAAQLIQIIRDCTDNRDHPDNIYGYGMPDFWKAYMKVMSENDE